MSEESGKLVDFVIAMPPEKQGDSSPPPSAPPAPASPPSSSSSSSSSSESGTGSTTMYTAPEMESSTASNYTVPIGQETEQDYSNPLFERQEEQRPKCHLKVVHPAENEIITVAPDEWAYFHSIVVPCTVRNPWAYIIKCVDAKDPVKTLHEMVGRHVIQGRACYSSLLARITYDLLDPKFVMPVAELSLKRLFSMEVTGVKVDRGSHKHDVYMSLHASVCRKIAEIMEGERGTPGMVKYQKLTKILAMLPRWHSWFVQEAITFRSGPVTDLAASVSIENINYWMNLFKVSASTDFLHRLFMSPSVMGKCSALVELLEIHGIMWQSVNVEHIQNFVALLYSLIKFMMETCKMAKNYAVQGFEWVSAKFRRQNAEADQFPGVEQDLPETEEEWYDAQDTPHNQVRSLSEFISPTAIGNKVAGMLEAVKNRGWSSAPDLTQMVEKLTEIEKRSEPSSASSVSADKDLHFYEVPHLTDPSTITSIGHTSTPSTDIRRHEMVRDYFTVPPEPIRPVSSSTSSESSTSTSDITRRFEALLAGDLNSEDMMRIQERMTALARDPNNTPQETQACEYILRRIGDARMHKVTSWLQDLEAVSMESVHYPPPRSWREGSQTGEGINIKDLVRSVMTSESVSDQGMTDEEASMHLARVAAGTPPPPIVAQHLENRIPERDVRSVCDLIKNMEFSELGKKFLEWCKRTFADVYKFFLDCPLVGAMIGIVYSILTFLGFTVSEFTTSGDKKTFFQKVSSSMRDMYYCQRGKDAIFSSFSHFVDVASNMLDLNKDKDVESFKQMLEMVQKELNKTVLEASTSPGTFVNDSKKFQEFKDVMEAVQAQYKHLISLNPKVNLAYLSPVWNQVLSSFNKLQNIWAKYLASGGLRQEPVCIWLYGKTMVGKSSYAQWLVDRLNKEQGTEWQSFFISKGPEYWNGYSQQEIVIIDDFGSYVGPEGCLDALAVMNLCSCAAYNPNMAALEDKAIQARPKVVIVCSNHPSIPMNSGITDMVAFERRRDIFCEVKWPEHEKCGPTKECEHWANKNQDNFDHLEFHLQNPIISEACTANPRMRQNARNARTDGVVYKQRDAVTLGTIAPEQMVELLTEKIKEKRANYEIQLARRERRCVPTEQAGEQHSIDYWARNPNVVLMGPPGTGKSTIFEKLRTKWTDVNNPDRKAKKVLSIRTSSDFDDFGKKGFEDPSYEVVIFDDTSSYLDSPKFLQFLKVWKSRYDAGDDSCPLWIIGVNKEPLMTALESMKIDASFYDVIMRRADVYHTRYKNKPGIRGMFGAKFGHRDVAKIHQEGGKINEMVEYYMEGKDDKYSCDSLTATIFQHEPKRQEEFLITRLPIRSEIDPDVSVRINMTSDEFIAEFVNSPGTLGKAISLLTGDNAEFRTKDSSISKLEIGQKILASYRRSQEVSGCKFTNMYDFILEGYVNKMFDDFQGIDCVMEFNDASYYIITTSRGIEAGVFEPKDVLGYKIALEANTIKQKVEGIDMASVMLSNLPPWFCLATQCIAHVMKMGATIFTCAQVVKQNNVMFRAMEREAEIEKKTSEFILESDKIAVDNLSHTLQAQNERSKVTPTYPKKPSGPNTVVHATIADKDPYPNAETQENSPDERHKHSHNTKMMKRLNTYGGKHQSVALSRPRMASVEQDVLCDEFKEVFQESVELQSVSDPTLPTIVGAVVKNCVDILDDRKRFLCHGLMIGGHTGTTVMHITRTCSKFFIRTITGQEFEIIPTIQELHRDRMDFRVVDKRCPVFKNIVNHITSKDMAPVERKPGILVTNSAWVQNIPTILIRSYTIESLTNYVADTAKDPVMGYAYVGTKTGFVIPDVNTYDGDCGSLLLVSDRNWPRKIIGLHTASNGQKAFAREIYAEDYIDVVDARHQSIVMKYKLPESGAFGMLDEFLIPNQNKTDKEGRPLLAISSCRQFTPATTRLWLSPMPYGPRLYEPSLLSQFDDRNPNKAYDFMAAETFKWCKERVVIPEEDIKLIKRAFEEIGDWYAQVIKARKCPVGVLTKTAALNKLSGAQHSKPIILKSSPGYPWNALSQSGKGRYIDVDPASGMRRFGKNPLSQMLINYVDKVIDDARNYRETFNVFKICLKDEMVKLKKIYEEPKTRTIAAAPLHLVIALRMYFHAAQAAMAECWDELPGKVGISANSLDWHLMFNNLASRSTLAFDFDYKGWDFTVPPEFMKYVPIVYNRIYKMCDPGWEPIDDLIRENMYEANVVKFKFLFMSRIYQSTGGMPSGQPGTAVDNSLCNLAFMYVVWMKLVPPGFKGFSDFLHDLGLAIYGDDILIAASPFALQYFNGVTVSDKLREFGLEVTSAVKDQPIVKYRPLEECEFMSRGFKRMYGFWVGPLREPQVVKCTHFVTTTKSHEYWKDKDVTYFEPGLYKDIADAALREMFLHGEEKFNSLRQHFMDNFAYLGISAHFPSFAEIHDEFFHIRLQSWLPAYPFRFQDYGPMIRPVKMPPDEQWDKFRNRWSINFGVQYKYTGSKSETLQMPESIRLMMEEINKFFNREYNSCLMNKYPVGGEIPWHKDDEHGLDQEQGVFCVTIKGDGFLGLKNCKTKTVLEHRLYKGCAYILDKELLIGYWHSRYSHSEETVSLTFRCLRVPEH